LGHRLRLTTCWLESTKLGNPHSGSKIWKALDREIGKPGENRAQIVARWEFQPAAAFHDRENRFNLTSRLGTADVHPVLGAVTSRDSAEPSVWRVRDFFPLGGRPMVTVNENGGREKQRG
jgi:hypothetical protein